MEIYAIPISSDGDAGEGAAGKYLIYRPLTGLAFIGNHAMANLCTQVAVKGKEAASVRGEAGEFLSSIGFFQPDPPQPYPVSPEYRPAMVVLLLTNRCQLRCIYCYAAAGEQPVQELSPQLGYAAIDAVCQNAQEAGLLQFEVSFHGGGEPSIAWKTLQACTSYARQKPLLAKVTLTSNGVWSSHQRDWILSNLDALSLSLDGGRETQDAARPFASGKGSFEWVMRTVAELDRRSFSYGIRMTATAPWSSFPEDVRFLCQHTGCRSIQVEPAFNTSRGGHARPMDGQGRDFISAFMKAFEIAQQAGRSLYYSGARLGLVTTTFCTAPYGALIVNAAGEMVTCYEIADHLHPLYKLSVIGKVAEGQPIMDREARSHLHNLMAERRAHCRECFCYWSCAGDCYTRTMKDEPGGHLLYHERCNINRLLTEKLLLWKIAESGGVYRATPRGVAPTTIGAPGEIAAG